MKLITYFVILISVVVQCYLRSIICHYYKNKHKSIRTLKLIDGDSVTLFGLPFVVYELMAVH